MRKDKDLAIKLRKSGNSYSQISKILKVPKSTLSYWLKDLKISNRAQEKINVRVYKKSTLALIERNKQQTVLAEKRAEEIKLNAKKEVKKRLSNKLFIAGVSLYWAEGYKKGAYSSQWKSVDFANSDPEMIALMMRFFREICKIADERIRIQLLVHPNVDVDKAVIFWSRVTKIPKSQFIKTCHSISSSSKGKRKKESLKYGTIHVRINDVKFFFKIIGWIDGLKLGFNVESS